MNMSERNARMIVAIKLMAEVIQDVKLEADKDGKVLSNDDIWKACGMPLTAHSSQLVELTNKQQLEFINSTTRNLFYGPGNTVENPS